MRKQKLIDPTSVFTTVVSEINKKKFSESKTLDIIEFAEKYTNKKLFPSQKIILKWFYAGSRFNEDIEVTQEEINLIKKWDIDQYWLFEGEKSKLNLYKENKKDKTKFFTDLVLVLGRRSGKTFMTALIATYEAYKLISFPDPKEFYNISADIWVINTATTGEQAKTEIYNEIKKFIMNCPVFEGRIGHDVDGYLFIRTDKDIENNKKITSSGGKPFHGSVVIAAGSSNARGLRGHSTIVCLEPNSLINTENGLFRVSDENIKNYNIIGKDCSRKPDDIIIKKEDIYSVKLANNKELFCTKDHKIFVLDDNLNINYKKVSDIDFEKDLVLLTKKTKFNKENYVFKEIDRVHIEKQKCSICEKEYDQITDNHIKSHGITFRQYIDKYGPVNSEFNKNKDRQKEITLPKEMSKKLAYILGLLYSEGCEDNKRRIDFTITDEDIAKLYSEYIKDVFNYNIKIRKSHKEGYKVQYHCNFMSKKICKFFEKNNIILNCGAKNKVLPECILQATEENVIEFLRGCFEGDGVQSKMGVGYTSSSLRLINDISVLLQGLGILPSIYKGLKKNNEYQYLLNMFSKNKDLFYKKIGFYSKKRKEYKNNERKILQDRYFTIPNSYFKNARLLLNKEIKKECKASKTNLLSCIRSVMNEKQNGISENKFLESIELFRDNFNSEEIMYFNRLNEIVSNYWLLKVKEIKISEEKKEVYDLNFYGEDHSFFADGILNHNCIYDELAHFVESESSSKSTSEEVYNALSPGALTFNHKGDGRNISISSPDLAQGFFYKHFNSAKDNEAFLLFQIPTWDANPTYPKHLFASKFEKDFERASAEFGAQFRQSKGNSFFPKEKIDVAFNAREDWYKSKKGVPGYSYFMHLDPASTSDRYAVMIAHPEMRYDHKTRTNKLHVVEDYSDYFEAKNGGYLDPDDIIDNHIFPLFRNFNIVSVTYDSMFSMEQQKKFNQRSINHRKLNYNGAGKNEMYMTALDFFINERIELCRDDYELKGELESILISYKKNPPKIMKNEGGEYKYDDLVDCLCGLIKAISTGESGHTRLPRAMLVRTSFK